jgi:hypothetical protein
MSSVFAVNSCIIEQSQLYITCGKIYLLPLPHEQSSALVLVKQ